MNLAISVIVNLMIPASALLVLNLNLEGPDDEEGVDAKHPPKDVADEVHDGDAAADVAHDVHEEDLQDVADLKDEAHSSTADPRLHEADVPLKNKDIGDQQNKKYKDIGDQ